MEPETMSEEDKAEIREELDSLDREIQNTLTKLDR